MEESGDTRRPEHGIALPTASANQNKLVPIHNHNRDRWVALVIVRNIERERKSVGI